MAGVSVRKSKLERNTATLHREYHVRQKDAFHVQVFLQIATPYPGCTPIKSEKSPLKDIFVLCRRGKRN